MKTLTKIARTTGAACLVAVSIASSAAAGGLADSIIETGQVMEPPASAAAAPQGGIPGWVLPAVGLLVIGAIASGDSGSDGETGAPPIVIDPK